MKVVKDPTCIEIANSFQLWGECVDPYAFTNEEDFEAGSAEKRLAIIHGLFPLDCNCGYIEAQYKEETK